MDELETKIREIFSGFGGKYEEPRPEQLEILRGIYEGDKFISLVEAPTGIGKSGVAMGLAKLVDLPLAVIATSTLSLQDQYCNDFETLMQLKGRGNFRCALDERITAAEAPCAFEWGVSCANGYHEQENRFYSKDTKTVVTNYSLLLSELLHGKRWELRRPDLLVCDEGHQLVNHLTRAETITLQNEAITEAGFKGRQFYTLDDAAAWCSKNQFLIRDRLDSERYRYGGKVKQLATLSRQVEGILDTCEDDDLVITDSGDTFTAVPIWPTRSANLLASKATMLLVMSATLVGRMFLPMLLGWEPQSTAFITADTPFPPSNWPVHFRPVVSLNAKSSESDWNRMGEACHDFIHERTGSSGIVHVASSKQVELISRAVLHCPACRLRLVLIRLGERRDETIRRFREREGSWIIHPSLGEGESFDDEQCRTQVIAKVRFPDLGDPLTKRRASDGERGQKFYFYSTAAYTAQTIGRGMRHKDDYCETFILDGAFANLYDRNKAGFPSWFQQQLSA